MRRLISSTTTIFIACLQWLADSRLHALTQCIRGPALLYLGLMCLALTPNLAATAEESSDERFVAGLRQRRLFVLAELYCRECLADASLDEVRRAQLTIELSRTWAEFALQQQPADRDAMWQRAGDVIRTFENQYSDHPRLILVRVQDALNRLSKGELLRQEAEVLGTGIDRWSTARTALREAINRLVALDEEATILLRQRRHSPDQLSEGELLWLQKHIHYQLARAYRNQALSYPIDTTDRIGSLTMSLKRLKPLALLPDDHPLIWSCRIDEIACHRLLGNMTAARHRLAAIQSSLPPASVQLRARAERIRLELVTGNRTKALSLLDNGRLLSGDSSAELDLTHVEVYIASWLAAMAEDDEPQSLSWQAKAVAMVDVIERTHGAYWTRRAESLLTTAAGDGGHVGNTAVLIRTAQNLYQRKQFDEAVAAFERAAASAGSTGDKGREFELRLAASRILHDQGHSKEALRCFRSLSLANTTDPRAGDTHLWAIINAAKLAKLAKQSETPSLISYHELLSEHLQHWPSSTTADTVRWWLGRLEEHQADWSEAVDAYIGISTEFDQFPDVVHACGRCWLRLLEQKKRSGVPFDSEARQAVAYHNRVIHGGREAWPERWGTAVRASTIWSARIRLRYQSDYAEVEQLLLAALNGVGEQPEEWRFELEMLLVVAKSGQRRYQDASVLLQRLLPAQPQQLIQLAGELQLLSPELDPSDRVHLANLQLEALAGIAPVQDQLDPAELSSLGYIEARALANAERFEEALKAYERLAQANPDNADAQIGLAEQLLHAEDVSRLAQARNKWREIANRTRPKSEQWYQAKYSLALAHYKLGDEKRAADIIRLVQAVPPGLESTQWKKKFLELLALCSNP